MGPHDVISEKIMIPEQMVGPIIGRGGHHIRWLQSDTGCSIVVTSDRGWCSIHDCKPGRVCLLTGDAQTIEKGKERIDAFLVQSEDFLTYCGCHGGGSPDASKGGDPPSSHEKLKKELDELKEKFETLCDILKCPVCWEVIQKDNVICVNGHSMCRKCKERQALQGKCPSCRGNFSKVKQNVLANQVLEVLSRDCKHANCSYKVKLGEDDHETYCCRRPTECRFSNCRWKGPVNELSLHVKNKHDSYTLEENASLLIKDIDFNKYHLTLNLFSAHGHYLWMATRSDPKTGMFTYTYNPVPKTSSCPNLSVEHCFKSFKTRFAVTKTVTMKENVDSSDENVLSIPISMMRTVWRKDKLELEFNLSITVAND